MTLATGIHHFHVGTFTCTVLCDVLYQRDLTEPRALTFVDDPAPLSFVNATADEVAVALDELTTTNTPTDMSNNVLLIDTNQHRVLVDTGNGQTEGAPGRLLELLAAVEIAVTDIDTVILTHADFDHIGANADDRGQPMFPNARYVMSQTEWTHSTRDPDTTTRAQLLAISTRVEQITMDAQIVPGIRAIPAPGHTPGQIALLIESGDVRLLHLADVLHHPIELLRPDWYFEFDADPALTVASRRALLDFATREQLPILAYHVAFPGLGEVVSDGAGWRWIPASA